MKNYNTVMKTISYEFGSNKHFSQQVKDFKRIVEIRTDLDGENRPAQKLN